MFIWCLRKCVLISCPSKSWFEGCEKQHPSACNKTLSTHVTLTLYRCVQNWTKTNCCGRSHSEYTITCKGSQYKISNSLNKVVLLGKYGSYSYSTFRGAHCWCLAAVLLRKVSLEGWIKHTVILNYNWCCKVSARIPAIVTLATVRERIVGLFQWIDWTLSPQRVGSESDSAVCSQIERFPSQLTLQPFSSDTFCCNLILEPFLALSLRKVNDFNNKIEEMLQIKRIGIKQRLGLWIKFNTRAVLSTY